MARFGLAVAVAALALGGRFALQPLLPSGFPFSTILIPVLVVSAVAGSGPGLLTFCLAGLPAWYWFGPTTVGDADAVQVYANLVLGGINNLAAIALGGTVYAHRRNAEAMVAQLREEAAKREAIEAERRENEERRRQSAKMEAIGQLAGGLAHDFNNQLSALSGFAHFVARDVNLSQASRSDLDLIIQAADRMAGLTRQLLAFSRRQVLTPETLSLGAAVREAQPLLQRLLGPTISVQLHEEGEPVWVRVDRAQLTQAILNLAINARDAMPQGGEVTLTVRDRDVKEPFPLRGEIAGSSDLIPPGDYAELRVSDSGSGITRRDLSRIFEPFFTTKEVGQGTGLGLSTVMGIVVQSQGLVWAESRPGQGTSFTILFPRVSEGSAAIAPASAGTHAPAAEGAPGLILVVDDEPAVRRVISRTLELEGYDVVQAQHGKEALDILATRPSEVRLVLSDVVMPVLGGREFADQLVSAFPSVPVIWMSGYARDIVFRDALGAASGLNDGQVFLQKPVSTGVLLTEVRAALGSASSASPVT